MRFATWNLFHGRDFPPNAALRTTRSRLFGLTERDVTHEQVNRVLLPEFGTVLDRLEWDVALLQEAPPRWLDPLARRCRAAGALGLTSRNELPWLRAALASWNPDLIASNDGGSNMVLVRAPGRIERVRRVRLATRPERRALLLARVVGLSPRPVTVACMHLSVGSTGRGPSELERAAALAVEFAAGDPIVLGGDLNLRPAQSAAPFRRLERELGFTAPTEPKRIDHLLGRDAVVATPAGSLPARAREVAAGHGRVLRLSDHTPVVASFEVR